MCGVESVVSTRKGGRRMTEEKLYEVAYNAHEGAEAAALNALVAHLRGQSVEALACLCDPEWRWGMRSWMSASIVDLADEVLNEKLDAAVSWDDQAA